MKLSELVMIKAELSPGPGMAIVDREIAQIKTKSDHLQASWNAYCTHYGLRPDQLGKIFRIKGTQYRITGINPGAPRFAVQCVRVRDSKSFRVPPDAARSAA